MRRQGGSSDAGIRCAGWDSLSQSLRRSCAAAPVRPHSSIDLPRVSPPRKRGRRRVARAATREVWTRGPPAVRPGRPRHPRRAGDRPPPHQRQVARGPRPYPGRPHGHVPVRSCRCSCSGAHRSNLGGGRCHDRGHCHRGRRRRGRRGISRGRVRCRPMACLPKVLPSGRCQHSCAPHNLVATGAVKGHAIAQRAARKPTVPACRRTARRRAGPGLTLSEGPPALNA